MSRKLKTILERPDMNEQPETKNRCRHYWVIESARAPTSKGFCKLCGEEKVFLNYIPTSWED